jgi:hypothetical protein
VRFYVQNEPPGEDKEPNWLPAPKGPFAAAMRLYDDDGIRTMAETSLDKVAAKVAIGPGFLVTSKGNAWHEGDLGPPLRYTGSHWNVRFCRLAEVFVDRSGAAF